MAAITTMHEVAANQAQTTLAAAINATATSLTVASGTGALFPTLSTNQFFRLSLTDAATQTKTEIMYVTAISSDTFTLARGQEGTTAQSWVAGDICANQITAGTLAGIVQATDLLGGTYLKATDASTAANSLIVTTNPAITTPTDGMEINLTPTYTPTGATTLTFNGLTAVPVNNGLGSALVGSEFIAGYPTRFKYSSSANKWYIVNAPISNLANLGLGGGLTGIVGQSRNAAMSFPAASASGTFTADEVIVETALGGTQYRLNSISLTVNLGTTGAGGMDTGSAPTSGYVAIYLMLNPITGSKCVICWNATNAKAAEIYSGSNAPAGYTASALVAVVPTNNLGQFAVGTYVRGRRVMRTGVTVLSIASNPGSYTAMSLAGAAPLNATKCKGYAFCNSGSGTGSATFIVAADTNGAGFFQVYAGTLGAIGEDITFDIDIVTPQTLYYQFTWSTTGVSNALLGINGYEF
jgi:hypothetical protein